MKSDPKSRITSDHDLAEYYAVPPRMLFVEDEDHIRSLLANFAREYRCIWDEAPTGEDSVKLLHTRAYNLVLLDLRLPGIDGFEVFRTIRAEFPELPVCIMTGVPLTEATIDRIYEIGWATFARKPKDFNRQFFRQLFEGFGIHPKVQEPALS